MLVLRRTEMEVLGELSGLTGRLLVRLGTCLLWGQFGACSFGQVLLVGHIFSAENRRMRSRALTWGLPAEGWGPSVKQLCTHWTRRLWRREKCYTNNLPGLLPGSVQQMHLSSQYSHWWRGLANWVSCLLGRYSNHHHIILQDLDTATSFSSASCYVWRGTGECYCVETGNVNMQYLGTSLTVWPWFFLQSELLSWTSAPWT